MAKPNKRGGQQFAAGNTQPKEPTMSVTTPASTPEETLPQPSDDQNTSATTTAEDNGAGVTLRGATRTHVAIDELAFQETPGTTMIAGLEAMKLEEEQAKDKALGLDLFSDELKGHIKNILADGTPLSKVTMHDVLSYVRKMAPGTPMSEEAGSSNQVQFYRTLVNYINNGPTDFRLFMGILLRLVMELREGHVFNERYLLRFLPSMALHDHDRRGFQYLMNLLTTTANPATRIQALKQTDLNKAVSFGLTEVGQKRLISYYQV